MSGMSEQSSSTPLSGPPVRVIASESFFTRAPMRASTSAKRASPWMVSLPSPSTLTVPSVMAAAARK